MKIKVNGKPHIAPDGWQDVKFWQFIQLIEAKQDSTLIVPILLGIKPEEARGAKIEGLELLLTKMSWLSKTPAIDEVPVKLGNFKLPEDPGFETVAQFEDTKKQIAKSEKIESLAEKTKTMADIAAIYAYPIAKGEAYLEGDEHEFYKKLNQFAEELMDYPCLEVMAVGSFFQTKCLSIAKDLPMSSLRANIQMKRSKRDLKSWAKHLASTLRWTLSRVMSGRQIARS